mmetsp:Transcript_27649/g.69712  ORF Transcript_27649/g.69712 Transcript_27649/m.69712 type:complete len:209 (+) Transcript_27649:2592-3218(+)
MVHLIASVASSSSSSRPFFVLIPVVPLLLHIISAPRPFVEFIILRENAVRPAHRFRDRQGLEDAAVLDYGRVAQQVEVQFVADIALPVQEVLRHVLLVAQPRQVAQVHRHHFRKLHGEKQAGRPNELVVLDLNAREVQIGTVLVEEVHAELEAGGAVEKSAGDLDKPIDERGAVGSTDAGLLVCEVVCPQHFLPVGSVHVLQDFFHAR